MQPGTFTCNTPLCTDGCCIRFQVFCVSRPAAGPAGSETINWPDKIKKTVNNVFNFIFLRITSQHWSCVLLCSRPVCFSHMWMEREVFLYIFCFNSTYGKDMMVLHSVYNNTCKTWVCVRAPSFEGLAGAEWDEGLFWRWRLRQGLFVICARQAIHPSSSQPKKGWSQKLAVSAQQQSRRAVKAERNWLISNAH